MDNPQHIDALETDYIPESDIVAMIAMLDYLISEIGRFDPMSAQCLVLARKSLAEVVSTQLVKAH